MRCEQQATLRVGQQTSQHLMLLPQMQQALVLLQAPLLELSTVLHEALEANPVWELEDPAPWPSDHRTKAGTAYCEERIEDQYATRHQIARDISEIFDNHMERSSALRLLEELNEDGVLEEPLLHYAEMLALSDDQLLRIIHTCQQLDPPGIFAFSPQHALLLQMERLGRRDTLGYQILRDHYEPLLQLKLKDLCRLVRLTQEELLNQLKRDFQGLRKLRPFEDPLNFGLLADATISHHNGTWSIEVHEDELPSMRVQSDYLAKLESSETEPAVGDYLEARYREGLFLKKALHQRGRTLRRILETVIPLQEAFLLSSECSPQELTMQQLADQLNLSESTLSRAVSNKWLSTPRGLVALRALFVAPGAVQGTLVGVDLKQRLRQLIDSEPTSCPYSDDELAEKMRASGFQMARRTVAKYRAQLGIPSQRERQWRCQG
jgi:RNA polymerase sigma-54 factor